MDQYACAPAHMCPKKVLQFAVWRWDTHMIFKRYIPCTFERREKVEAAKGGCQPGVEGTKSRGGGQTFCRLVVGGRSPVMTLGH